MLKKGWQRILVAALLVVGVFGVWIWASAPPDPVYLGKRFSACLYESRLGKPGQKIVAAYPYHEAIRAKGVEAAPLLAAWLETEHPALLLRLQDLLRKYKLSTQILPADRQDIAFVTLRQVPLLGATRAIQLYLLTGNGLNIRQKAAVVFMDRFNSAPVQNRMEVAAESGPFISKFLDSFERTHTDEYALTIIGVLIETKPDLVSDELAERIRRDAGYSRYLRRAEEALARGAK
jgi:hypothetical protein